MPQENLKLHRCLSTSGVLFVCMYMIQYVCAFIPNYIENVQMSILATVLPLAKYKNPNSIYSMKLRIWSYIKTSSYSLKEKKHTQKHPFSPTDFTQKSINQPTISPDFGPFKRRLVIRDPFLSVRRAIGTRFYAPPWVAGSVSCRFHATPWFGSGFGPPGEWRWHHNSHESPR